MIKCTKTLTAALALGLGLASQTQAATLAVNVNGIQVMEGHLMVVLCKGEASYIAGESPYAAKVKVGQAQEVVVFEDIDNGEYAVKLFHDENDNGELDTNFVGIPKEGYGFSNNGGKFGAPKYQDARFEVKDDTTIDIDLN